MVYFVVIFGNLIIFKSLKLLVMGFVMYEEVERRGWWVIILKRLKKKIELINKNIL